MDFGFTPDQDALREEVRKFIAENVTPEILQEVEDRGEGNRGPLVRELYTKIGERGWIGISWPTEYGGQGGDRVDQYIVEEGFGRVGIAVGSAGSGAPALLAAGTEEQKRYFLPRLISGDIIFALGFTEPQGGADLAGLQCRAAQDGDDYVINGQKIFTSAAHYATHIYLMCRTDPDLPKHRGISIFLVPMDTSGITVRPLWTIQQDSPPGTTYGTKRTNETFFEDVRVPATCMLGEKNMGWYVAMTTLDNERSGIRDVARAARQWDDTTEALRQTRHIRGIRTDRVMVHKLAEMGLELEVSRKLSYRTGWMQQNNMGPNLEASMAKLFATELWQRMCRIGMEMLGLYSQARMGDRHTVLDGAMPEAYMGNIPSTIAAGSSEINRNIMATRGLGLPRGF